LISDIEDLRNETKLSATLTLSRVFHCPTGITSEALRLRLRTRLPPSGIALNGFEFHWQKTETDLYWNIDATIQPENRLIIRFDAGLSLLPENFASGALPHPDKISPESLSDGVKSRMNVELYVDHNETNTREFPFLEVAVLEIDDE